MLDLLATSNKLHRKIKVTFPKSNIHYFGKIDITNIKLVNEIKNKLLGENIHSFLHNLLLINNYPLFHFIPLYDIFIKHLSISKVSQLNKLYKLLTVTPYQLDIKNNIDNINSMNDIFMYYKDYFDVGLCNELINYTANAIGKGELFFGLLTELKNSSNHGDLVSNDNLVIELKGPNSRLKTLNGYGSPTGAYNYLSEQLLPYFLDKTIFDDSLKWNFTFKSIEFVRTQLNDLLETESISIDQLKEILVNVFKLLYVESNIDNLNVFVNNQFENNRFIEGIKFLDNFLILQYKYLKQIAHFDYIFLLDENHYIIITDINDFINKTKYFTYSGFSWASDRCFVYALTLKKKL